MRSVEPLDEAECLQLISAGGIGRIGYTGRYGPTVLPVNFVLQEQAVVFRTGQDSPMGEDLRTGIADADYIVAFEVDEISQASREGWSILIQGSAHHVDSDHERAAGDAVGRRGLARRGERPVHPHPPHPHHRPAYSQAAFIDSGHFQVPAAPWPVTALGVTITGGHRWPGRSSSGTGPWCPAAGLPAWLPPATARHPQAPTPTPAWAARRPGHY